jgi:hypothetical protein
MHSHLLELHDVGMEAAKSVIEYLTHNILCDSGSSFHKLNGNLLIATRVVTQLQERCRGCSRGLSLSSTNVVPHGATSAPQGAGGIS